MSEKKDLTELRSEIDSIDRELMRLFEERMNISRQVGDYKRERGMPVFDETREKEVIAPPARPSSARRPCGPMPAG